MAIQWERHLHELAKTGRIDIRCGCVLGRYKGQEGRDIVERICAEHSAHLLEVKGSFGGSVP